MKNLSEEVLSKFHLPKILFPTFFILGEEIKGNAKENSSMKEIHSNSLYEEEENSILF